MQPMNRRFFICSATSSILCATRYGLCHAFADSEEEPYAIYSVLLTSSKREVCDQSKLWLIGNTTVTPDPPSLLTQTEAPLPPIIRAINAANRPSQTLELQPPPDLLSDAREAIEDYRQNGEVPVRLERKFRLPGKYLILSGAEQQQYFDLHPHVITSDWRPDATACARFRKANGIDSLSRVCFNQARTFAMVFLHSDRGGCGTGCWKTFAKTGSLWSKLKCQSTTTSVCA
jgi:hypothetical protein